MSKERITVQTKIKAPISKVWELYTQPNHIINWNFANDEWCCPNAKNDLKKGREFNFRMEAKDGSMGFDFTGKYENVVQNELITYKIMDGRNVDVEFSERKNEVHLKQIFDAEGTNSDEQQKNGWQAILDNFKKYAETK
ncbi:SRPBCC domain-containing protein [Formosa sp. PL04]|uniref:SRPBCC domain-containing protein n=1 Tax=Formosa sp. PL04 TaxID=3081755 RepID=UPI0029825F14|nr:SRPBCC domain-containing protein [Formosa sp. PL04]MDW5289539.1 SRPBCC domain-containing protein [Formosa sp. PL04]